MPQFFGNLYLHTLKCLVFMVFWAISSTTATSQTDPDVIEIITNFEGKTACELAKELGAVANLRWINDKQEAYETRAIFIETIDAIYARWLIEDKRFLYIAAIDGIAEGFGIENPSCGD